MRGEDLAPAEDSEKEIEENYGEIIIRDNDRAARRKLKREIQRRSCHVYGSIRKRRKER